MTNYTVGILIIGSLFWDTHKYRESWRQQRLNLECKIPVRTPIRYGRESESRQYTYTMVFSKELSIERYGWALVVPCRNAVTNANDLVNEAKALWAAERSESETDRLSAKWGAVGILTNSHRNRSRRTGLNAIKKGWIKHIVEEKKKGDHYTNFCHKDGEEAAVNSDGILTIPWPYTESDTPVDVDFLLATATSPTLEKGSYAAVGDIAKAWKKAPKEQRYFDENRRAGITTADDYAIIKHLCEPLA